MVSIGIIAALIAILVPALAGARKQAVSIKSLSNARQLASVIQTYADESRGLYPAIIEGRFYPATGRYGDMFSFPYWQVWSTWTGVVFDHLPYYANVEIYISPLSTRLADPSGMPWPTSYSYSTSFVGAPELWRAGAQADPALQRGMRVSDVRYPSSKALLWDAELGWMHEVQQEDGTGDLLNAAPMSFADLSGHIRVPAEATTPIPNPFDHPAGRASLHNTPDGVFGLDYR